MHTVIAAITAASIWAFWTAHQLVIYYVFSVLVEQLPPPVATSNGLYKYAYSVIQILAANLRRTKDAVKA